MARFARRGPNPHRHGRRGWPLAGLLLPLALLGHDGLMAADAHAAATERPVAAGGHVAEETGVPVPAESGCEVGFAAAARLDPRGRPDAAPASPVAALPALAGVLPRASTPPPPPPPGVRRALLQVFLI